MPRKSMPVSAILVALLTVVLSSSLAVAAQAPAVPWWVVAGGGGHSEAGGFTLDATVGQAVAGTAQSGPWDLCAGFWCGPQGLHHIYLPLVVRGG
jgi:hypothetical protein